MKVERFGSATLYLGDSREILPTLPVPGVVVTDPPWGQAKDIPGAHNPRALFAAVAPWLCRGRLVVVQLGCYTDPCFVSPIADRLPFIHACWLRYVPPSYNGRVLVDADIAYVYGTPPRSRPGARVLPSMCQSVAREPIEREFLLRHGKNRTSAAARDTVRKRRFPMPRCLAHVRWLTHWHTEPADVVLDPFMGSGTTGIACVQLGRAFVGIEVDERFFDLSCERIEEAQRQGRLPDAAPAALQCSLAEPGA